MSVHEELSRLLEGELAPEEAEALRRRIEHEPAVAEAWTTLQGLGAGLAPLLVPPPGLNARIVRAHARRTRWWLYAAPLLLAAALVLLWLWPAAPAELLLADGMERIDGQARVIAGDVVVEVDGIAEVSVEPVRDPVRGAGTGGTAMERRKTLVAAMAGAAVTITVYEGTARVWAAPDAEPTVWRQGQTFEVAPQPQEPEVRPQVDSDHETLRARIAELELQNRLLESMLETQELSVQGQPIPWPSDLPAELTPAGFERQVREAVDACAPDVQVLGFECTEPPCLALLRTPPGGTFSSTGDGWWDRLVNQCPQWVDAYSSSVSSASASVTCPDGSTEQMQLLGWSTHLIESTHPTTDAENAAKRFRARVEEAKAAWPCE